MKKRLLSLALCLLLGLSLLPTAALAAEPVTVTIFSTNDIHGVVAGSDSAIGLPQTAAIRASTPNALLVDAGDATQGASFATVGEGADVIAAMNAAGYDAMVAGNHEFDYGAQRLLDNAALADFPILAANVQRDGAPLLDGSAVVEAGGERIGFIGLTTTATATSTNPAQLAGITFEEEVSFLGAELMALEDRADAVVLLCHLGDNAAAVPCTSRQLLDGLEDDQLRRISAVVDGHSHTVEDWTYTREGTDVSIPVVQTGTQFTALGRVELTFADDGVTAAGSVLDYAAASAYPLTPAGETAKGEVEAALAALQEGQEAVLGQTLCETDTPLWGGNIYWDYSEPRIVETSYGDLVTDAFADSARTFATRNGVTAPVVAVENGGGISAALPWGQVTRGDVLGAFNHGNMVEALEITPAQLYAALEIGLTMTGQDETGLLLRERVSGSFLQVSGFSYTYDPAGESGAKVTQVVLDDGAALDRDDETTALLLATNSYVASAFPAQAKLGELGGEDQIVMEYLLAQTDNGATALSVPADGGRIHIANDKSPATYTVTLPVVDAADGETPLAWQTFHLRVDQGGYQTVTTNGAGELTLEVSKGPHTFYLQEGTDGRPSYTNNYSGSGTVTTREGYYRLGFLAQAPAPSGWTVKQLTDYRYDDVYTLREDVMIMVLDGKWGYLDATGAEIVPPRYDDVYNFDEGGLALVQQDGKWGYIDQTGEQVIPCRYDDAYAFYEGLASVKVGDKYGFIDQTGAVVIPAQYDATSGFSEGLAVVGLDGKYGFINKTGEQVIPCRYEGVGYFHDGLAVVELDGKWGYIDQTGEQVIPCQYGEAYAFDENGLAAVTLDGKWGYIDKSGSIVVPCRYDGVYAFSEGLALVELDGKWGYLDQTGREVVPPQYDVAYPFHGGVTVVMRDGKWGYLDKTGELVIPFQYDAAYALFEGLGLVELDGKWGYIDQTGAEVIPLRYDGAYNFAEDGLALVELRDKWGLIDQTGQTVLPCRYESTWHLGEGLVAVQEDGKVAVYSITKTAPSHSTSTSSGRGSRRDETTAPEDTQQPSTPSATTTYTDVAAGSWYEAGVNFVTEKGLFNGVGEGRFAPNDNMTRAMLMTVLARLAGQDTTGGSAWYEKGMAWAVAQGVSDGTAPEANITREQLVTMLYRYAKSPAVDAAMGMAGYMDANNISDWAQTAMRWAVENGILTGKDGARLDPQGNATRAEVAVILQRFVEAG